MIEVQTDREERARSHVPAVAKSNWTEVVQSPEIEKDNAGILGVVLFYVGLFGLSAWNLSRVVWYLVK